jgi:hypothetical protein
MHRYATCCNKGTLDLILWLVLARIGVSQPQGVGFLLLGCVLLFLVY